MSRLRSEPAHVTQLGRRLVVADAELSAVAEEWGARAVVAQLGPQQEPGEALAAADAHVAGQGDGGDALRDAGGEPVGIVVVLQAQGGDEAVAEALAEIERRAAPGGVTPGGHGV